MHHRRNNLAAAWSARNVALLVAVVLVLNDVECSAGSSSVVAWGGDPSQVGVTNVPESLTNVVAIASGDQYNLVLKADGTLVGWGATTVPNGLSNVVAVAAGKRHSLALKNDGTVVAWGYDFFYPTVVPVGLSNVVAVASGYAHSLALRNDGTVVAWSSDDSTHGDLYATNVPAGLNNIIALAPGGAHHCLVLKDDGTEFGWGDNNAGSVTGVDSQNPPYYATGQAMVAGQIVSNIVALAAGNHPSLALKSDGTVVGWPADMTVPAGLSNVVVIAAGDAKDLALKSDGTVVAWGYGYGSQSLPPAGLSNVVAVTVSAALVDDSAPFDGSPFIVQHPMNRTTSLGSTALFVVGAIGTVPLSYQWQFNGTNIAGANRTALLLL